MNKIVLMFSVFIMFIVNAQKKSTMNKDTIKISDNISLFQKKERIVDPSGIFWELSISNKKEKNKFF